jgi:AcrR family transcriptional regulator
MRTILDTVASLRRSPTNWIVTPDRIAEQAKANKRLTYVDFGNKEQLFETIVGRALGEPADAVPFTPDDLPGYAAALVDHLIGSPRDRGLRWMPDGLGGLSPPRTTGPAGLLVWLSRRSRLLWQPPARR